MKMIAKDNAHCDTMVTEIQWNPVNVDTRGICHSVCIIQVLLLKDGQWLKNGCIIKISSRLHEGGDDQVEINRKNCQVGNLH